MPDFSLEIEADCLVAGVDEVGRGPLCGPVVAAAAMLDPERIDPALAARIDDSKKLKATAREEVADALFRCASVGLGAASVAEIERLNILHAAMLAMRRAVMALPATPELALVDGNRAPDLPCPVRTVIKGDGISISIAAASIVAKVTRDRIMTRLETRYPGYGWARNAGYGTAEHRAALETLGVTPHHRKLFAPVNKILSRA